MAIDSAQGAPHEKIFFDDLGADFLSVAAHKMAGPTGIGCLLVSDEALSEMGPFLTGGSIVKRVSLEDTLFQEGYAMFETGTPRMAEAIGWRVAVDWLEENIDFEEAHKHVQVSHLGWLGECVKFQELQYLDSQRERSQSVSFLSCMILFKPKIWDIFWMLVDLP